MMSPYALIIDDDVNNLDVLCQLLQEQGVSSTLVKDPTEVIETVAHLPKLDVIFCDLEMPKIDGYSLLHSLRAVVNRHVQIICVSVHVSELTRSHKLGFDGFIGKPLDADAFPSQLQRILSGQAVWELP